LGVGNIAEGATATLHHDGVFCTCRSIAGRV